MAHRFLRFIPKDPGTTVAAGWCFTSPQQPPDECSWCGKETEIIETASNKEYLFCLMCDEPRAKDYETDDGFGSGVTDG